MSCMKWEESVYLYHELTVVERKKVHAHLQQCDHCNALFKKLEQTQTVIHQAAGYNKPLIKDPGLLTNKIMKAIPPTSANNKLVDLITSLMNSFFTRYALGAVSLLLIFFFVNEQHIRMDVSDQVVVISESKASIPLHSKEFMKIIKQERIKAQKKSLYLCIKSNQCDNGIVKIYKQRKNNENI